MFIVVDIDNAVNYSEDGGNYNYIPNFTGRYVIIGYNYSSSKQLLQEGNFISNPVSDTNNGSKDTPTYVMITSGSQTQNSNNNITGYASASNSYTNFIIVVTHLIGTSVSGGTTDSPGYLAFGWKPTFSAATNSNVILSVNNTTSNQLDLYGSLSISRDLNITGNINLNKATISTANITTLNASSDATFNGNVTIGGRLYIGANSIYANSIMGGTLSTTSDLSLNTRLFVGADASLNANLYVKGNVKFDGTVNFSANTITTDSIQMGVNNYFGMFQYQYSGKTLYDLDSNRFLITRYVVDSETRNVLYSNTALTINGNITSMYDMSINGNLSVGNNISITGRSTATSFTTASDYRIKANVQSLLDTSFTVDLLKPVTYINTKLNVQDIGFIAHEVQEQIPFLVTGEKDGEEFQSLNYTAIIGILTKEIQELKREMKEVKTELALLKK
jgi:hypothetical protein